MQSKTEQAEEDKPLSLQILSFKTADGIIDKDWGKNTGKN